MTKKLLLINPHPPGHMGEESLRVIVQMPLNLAYIAALTPDDWEVDVIDENIETALDERGNLKFKDADFVGVTSVTYQVPRAYEIAKACRAAGIPTILGGAHASTNWTEAQQHFDSVMVGDAETAWAGVLKDVKDGKLEEIYRPGPIQLDALANQFPDRELLTKKYDYEYSSIVTTRGCPFLCDFCSVPIFQGRKYRMRPPEDVWHEMESIDYQGLMFAEDNFYGYGRHEIARAREMFKGMADRGIKKDWFGFTTLNTCFDDEALANMAKSGCMGFLMGVESLDPAVLKVLKKHINLKMGARYQEGIQNLHRHGMISWGSVIFGTDADSPEVFDLMADFALEVGMDVMTFGIWTPMPATAGHKRMTEEGRLFRDKYPDDWYWYTSGALTHVMNSMPLEHLIEGLERVFDKMYSKEVLRQRLKRSLEETQNPKSAMFAYRINPRLARRVPVRPAEPEGPLRLRRVPARQGARAHPGEQGRRAGRRRLGSTHHDRPRAQKGRPDRSAPPGKRRRGGRHRPLPDADRPGLREGHHAGALGRRHHRRDPGARARRAREPHLRGLRPGRPHGRDVPGRPGGPDHEGLQGRGDPDRLRRRPRRALSRGGDGVRGRRRHRRPGPACGPRCCATSKRARCSGATTPAS